MPAHQGGRIPRIPLHAAVAVGVLLTIPSARAFAHPQASRPSRATPASARVAFRVPADSELHDSAYRASALRGRALLLATRDSLPHNVGNSLRCASCHLDNGLRRDVMPWVGSYARFPQYRPRSAKVDLIEDRINDCFARSMNGKPLSRDGRDMRDIVAYLAFLSNGIPVGAEMEGQGLRRLTPRTGDLSRGLAVFSTTCARCHGGNGAGTVLAPPVWGARSYNVGAGMANIITAASFIHVAMPYDHAVQLTEQQAFDVATYINTRPRPDFAGRIHDWPKGGKPPGADYTILPAPRPISSNRDH
jgi:thiosulfate dehydrogenase